MDVDNTLITVSLTRVSVGGSRLEICLMGTLLFELRRRMHTRPGEICGLQPDGERCSMKFAIV